MNTVALQKMNTLPSPQRLQAVTQTVQASFGQQFQKTYDNNKPRSQGKLDVMVGDYAPSKKDASQTSSSTAASSPKELFAGLAKSNLIAPLEVSPFVAFSQLMVRIQHALLNTKHRAVESDIQKKASAQSPLTAGILA
jgi:hypothetical protein